MGFEFRFNFFASRLLYIRIFLYNFINILLLTFIQIKHWPKWNLHRSHLRHLDGIQRATNVSQRFNCLAVPDSGIFRESLREKGLD